MPTNNVYAIVENTWDSVSEPFFSHALSVDKGSPVLVVSDGTPASINLDNLGYGEHITFMFYRETEMLDPINTVMPVDKGLPLRGSVIFYRDREGLHIVPVANEKGVMSFGWEAPELAKHFFAITEERITDDDPLGLIGWRGEYLAMEEEGEGYDWSHPAYLALTEEDNDVPPKVVEAQADNITATYTGADALVIRGTILVLASAVSRDIIIKLYPAEDAVAGEEIVVKKVDSTSNSVTVVDNTGATIEVITIAEGSVSIRKGLTKWEAVLCLHAIDSEAYLCHDEDMD